ncbi:MAG: PIG-L family deacetylase [Comamonadaceae bacterium]|nr:PIG-L family deacetylase [Comamonadaceae bacterium]
MNCPPCASANCAAACAALGIQPPRLLDYADGHLHEADAETMIAQILSVVNEIKPQVLLSFGPDGLSGHPDHIAVGQWAAEAFRRAEAVAALYTVAVPQSLAQKLDMRQVHPVPDEAIALTVDVSSVWETKLAAMRCHATQLSSSPMMQRPQNASACSLGVNILCALPRVHPAGDFLPEILKGYLQ